MGEGVVDPTSHLVCYKTAKYLYRACSVQRPHTLYIPTTVGVPAAALRDAYGSQLIHKHNQDRFCTPTGIDGEPRLEDAVKLRCDAMKGKTAFTRTKDGVRTKRGEGGEGPRSFPSTLAR